jgi:hypothetical protein
MYTCIYKYVYMYTCIYIIHSCMYKYNLCIYKQTHVYIHVLKGMGSFGEVFKATNDNIYVYICIHVYINMYIYIHVYI